MKPRLYILLFRLLLCITMAGFVLPYQVAMAQKAVYSLTPGKFVVIHGRSQNAAAYQWYKNDQRIAGAIEADYKTYETGIYKVEAFNSQSCPSTMSEAVEVRAGGIVVDMAITKQAESKPVLSGETFTYLLTVQNKSAFPATNVLVRDTLPIGLEYVAILNNTKGEANYADETRTVSWALGSVEPYGYAELSLSAKAQKSGAITNKASVTAAETDPVLANNQAADTKQIIGLNIPNVFTPNGDGKNDTFEIPAITTLGENEIVIVNRWGNIVYQKKGYLNDWDGSGLNEGTYFYVFKLKNALGVWDAYKGYVTLLRTKQ